MRSIPGLLSGFQPPHDKSISVFLSYFFKKITLSRRLWYARVGLYVTPIRLGLLSTLTANQITDSKCVSSE